MHKARVAGGTETAQVTLAEHPVPLQIPAPSLRSKGLLVRHREDAARAYHWLYPRAKRCWKGLEMHRQGGMMNPPSSIQITTNQTLCGGAKRGLLELLEPPKVNPSSQPSPPPSALRPSEPISI